MWRDEEIVCGFASGYALAKADRPSAFYYR